MTKSAISHQLRTLREANLVKNRREGKIVYYSLADDHVCQLLETGLAHIRRKSRGMRAVFLGYINIKKKNLTSPLM